MFPFSGLTAQADSFIKKNTSGLQIQMNGLDLSLLNAQLGAYMRKFEKDIWRLVTKDIEFEKYMRKVSNVTDEYVISTGSMSEVLQPFQSTWTPKGTTTFDPRINKVRQIKADVLIDNIDDIYRTYLAYLADEDIDRSKWPLVRYIVEQLIVPKMRAELAELSVNGKYAAPTPGTPGASIDSVDGILTIIDDEITASNLTPIVTGAMNQSNIIDKLEVDFYDQLPSEIQKLPGQIFVSENLRKTYWRAYRNEYGGNTNYTGTEKVFLDGTRKELVGIPEMNGSQRIIHTTPGNMLLMYDKIYTPNNMQVQLEKRDVILLTDFKRGYGFGTLAEVFVNDQA